MNQGPGTERDDKVLSEQLATRVLTRASELDAALRAGASVAELRRAALEAGISAEAFEAALAEVQDAGARVPEVQTQPRSRQRRRMLAAVLTAVVAIGAIGITRTIAPVATAPMVEEAFLLRCLAPGEAAELIRPMLRLPGNTVVISPENASRVLTVRATPSQIQEVRALFERYEGQRACTPTPGAQ